ncbi:tetratricopeptide repeat protein [Sediminispirochaeta smaragdinae]|jgi:tetratricopeptide (TPR) repeat protein|uniref:Restriction endonuclease n=1 Tax=Sediminispirochaeta smaragdinae (strain DSM 11293 / JCM 15392 / SEBR 4228) TaxID=573413 RepID=E1R1V3_SEDSS|nr:tetratricopeptide repeat protein [Sediminispirochaeta smaragdinae]ADK81479.1 restriction endonuclease [Sediminispirochaeta smaragdinae DSM 11293]
MPLVIALIIILGIGIGLFTFFLVRSIIAPKQVASLENALKQGKPNTVVRIAKQIIAKNPRNAEAHYYLGLAYLAQEKPELALMELKTVNQIGTFGPGLSEVAFRKRIADLFERFNQEEEALKEYLLLIKLEPQSANHYYKAGSLFEARQRSEKALNYYRKAIELDPRHSDAHYSLGYALFRGKKVVEAKIELEEALKHNPNNYKAHFYLGKLLKENHDYVAALLNFEKAQRDPEIKIRALVERGSCYMHMNSFDKAVTELERAIKLSVNDSSQEVLYARYFLALCYEKSRDFEKAIEQWEAIYKKKPSFRDVAEKLSQYQELRTDDRIKDYLTAGPVEFLEICKGIALSMELNIRDVTDIKNGCQIIAVESDSRWRNAKKMPKLLWFLRVPEMITESTVRSILDEMKKMSVTRGVIFTSSNFSRRAAEFSESRPVELIDKDALQNILRKVKLN